MRPDALIAWMRRHEAPAPRPGPVCILCEGASGHPPIDDDGPARCVPCLYRIGRIVGDPAHTPVSVVATAWEDHKDLVELRSCSAHVIEWRWLGWTSDRETLLDPGGGLLVYGQALVIARQAEATGGRL